MAERTSSPDIALLLTHKAWLQRLARHLVDGNDGAEDVVQETWVAALRGRGPEQGDPRPWIAGW